MRRARGVALREHGGVEDDVVEQAVAFHLHKRDVGLQRVHLCRGHRRAWKGGRLSEEEKKEGEGGSRLVCFEPRKVERVGVGENSTQDLSF